MKRTQENFLDWAEDGMAVTGVFGGDVVNDAKLTLENGAWFACQNELDGGECIDKKGYKFSWYICRKKFRSNPYDVTNLRPAKQSHHRKPSPESELVGSCTLLKKWKWLLYDGSTCYVSTHKPKLLGNTVSFTGNGAGFMELPTKFFGRINQLSRKESQRLYRRQGDKWVHVGGAK